ncbi:MAG: prepilin-type N-terminal cleavage/methylation domain-containing protein [Bdellovibrionales bacterium]|nr:prepilin-type N-terminal cleavage/methylation domain-containing protein [Bdellovibrionales bacterium]
MKISREKAFTLTEIMIALSIMSVVMVTAYGALRQITHSKTVLDNSRNSQKMANAILSRITRELQLAYDGVNIMPPRNNPNQKVPPNTHLIGETRNIGQGQRGDRIRFLALEGGQYLPDGGAHSGIVQISYRVEKDPEAKKIADQDLFYLVREETPYIRPFKDAYENQTMIFPITKNLSHLIISYYDGEQEKWYDEWGTQKQTGLPTLIYFSFGVVSPNGLIESFSSIVPIRIKG